MLSATAICSCSICYRGESSDPLLWGYALEGLPITADDIHEAESKAGIPPNLILFYVQWPGPSRKDVAEFPLQSVEIIRQREAVPCISWEPMYIKNEQEHTLLATTILSGEYDGYIRRFAEAARSWGHPVLLRFAHEMNIQRYHWGTAEEDYGPPSPRLYRQMFRHIADVFKDEQADNVLFVWCPNAESVPDTSSDTSTDWNAATNYYPGDEYVDVIGMDGYNWGDTQVADIHGWTSRWQTLEEILAPLYTEVRSLAPDKPVLICEFASARSGGDRRQWFAEAVETIKDWEVEGAVWFQVDSELDWRLDADTMQGEPSLPLSSHSQTQRWLERILNGKK